MLLTYTQPTKEVGWCEPLGNCQIELVNLWPPTDMQINIKWNSNMLQTQAITLLIVEQIDMNFS